MGQPRAPVVAPAAENLMVKQERGARKRWVGCEEGTWPEASQGAWSSHGSSWGCGTGLAPLSHLEHGTKCVRVLRMRIPACACAWGGHAGVGEGAVWCLRDEGGVWGCGVAVGLCVEGCGVAVRWCVGAVCVRLCEWSSAVWGSAVWFCAVCGCGV